MFADDELRTAFLSVPDLKTGRTFPVPGLHGTVVHMTLDDRDLVVHANELLHHVEVWHHCCCWRSAECSVRAKTVIKSLRNHAVEYSIQPLPTSPVKKEKETNGGTRKNSGRKPKAPASALRASRPCCLPHANGADTVRHRPGVPEHDDPGA